MHELRQAFPLREITTVYPILVNLADLHCTFHFFSSMELVLEVQFILLSWSPGLQFSSKLAFKYLYLYLSHQEGRQQFYLCQTQSISHLLYYSTAVGCFFYYFYFFLFETLQGFLLIHTDGAFGSRLSKIIRVMNHNQEEMVLTSIKTVI